MKRFKQLVAAVVGLLALIGLLRLRSCVKGDGASRLDAAHTPLSPKDKEEVLYNSSTHELTIKTQTGSKTEYARNPEIHIQKDGTVKVNRKLYGLELSPFMGIGYGGGTRLHLGVSGLYIWRFDLSAQVAVSLNGNTPRTVEPVLSLGYNFYRNTSVFVGADPVQFLMSRTPVYHVGLSVKF